MECRVALDGNQRNINNQLAVNNFEGEIVSELAKMHISNQTEAFNSSNVEELESLVLNHKVTKEMASKKIHLNISVLIQRVLTVHSIDSERKFLHVFQNELFMMRFEYLSDSKRPTEPLDAGMKFKLFTKRAKAKIKNNLLDLIKNFEQQTNFCQVQNGRMGGSSSITGTGQTVHTKTQLDTATENWNKAEAFIRNLAIKHNASKEVITLDAIQEVNKMLTSGLAESGETPGALRNHDVFTGTKWYLPGELVKKSMEQFIVFLGEGLQDVDKEKSDPIDLSASAYQRSVSIHPFSDGNGRSTRLIMDYVLIRSGILPPQFAEDVSAAVFCNVDDGDPANAHPLEVQKKVAEGIVKTQSLLNI